MSNKTSDDTKKAQFLRDFTLYDAITKQAISPPIFKGPIDFVLLDHDKTMTYKADKNNTMRARLLHPWTAEILKEGLTRNYGFAICSTAHTTRLIRQYRDGIRNAALLSRLMIIAEAGSVFAIPNANEKLSYDIFEAEKPPELFRSKKTR